MTIDTLARMTAEQFAKVDERFDAVDARFDKVDERFDAVDARFDKMDHTLKNILDVVLEIPSKKSFERLETKVQDIDTRLASVERRIRK